MPFVEQFNQLPLERLVHDSLRAPAAAVQSSLAKDTLGLADFAHLVSPAGTAEVEAIAQRAQVLTRQRFGKVIRLFAPLYLSNECINNCSYCGFSRDNPILRVTLSLEDVIT